MVMSNIEDRLVEQFAYENIIKKDLLLDENTIKARKIREGLSGVFLERMDEEGNLTGELFKNPSTVVMTSAEETDEDGNPVYIAFPTIFFGYEDEENQVSREEWLDLRVPEDVFPEEAYQLASSRDEIFYFNTKKEAEEFALGSWKPEEYK